MNGINGIDDLLEAWDAVEDACQRVETALPLQMSAAIAKLEAARFTMRTIVQRHALAATRSGSATTASGERP